MVSQDQDELVEWVGRCVLPCEAYVRGWLRRASVSPVEIDDIIQEAYSRISEVRLFRRIANPRAYFLEVARNILYEQLRRSRIVRIDTVAELESLNVVDDRPSQEQATITREDIARLKRLIDGLPDRCRKMFVMRKIEGLSQKQIAQALGVTENTVETQVGRGFKLILSAWAGDTRENSERHDVEHDRTTLRRKSD